MIGGKKAPKFWGWLIVLTTLVAFVFPNTIVHALDWSSVTEISYDEYNWVRQFYPSIAIDSGQIHVCWCEEGPSGWQVVYRNHNGFEWQETQTINSNANNNFQPDMAVANGIVHIVWLYYDSSMDQDIYHVSYDGSSWSRATEISTDDTSWDQNSPSVAAYKDNCYVVWEELGDDKDIFYRKYDGYSWLPEEMVNIDEGSENQYDPAIAADNGNVHITWTDNGDGDGDIYLRSHDGNYWQAIQEVNDDLGSEHQASSSIAVEDNKIYVAWADYRDGDWDIYFTYYTGNNWQVVEEISTDTTKEDQLHPSISVDNGQVHVVWVDKGSDEDIHYRYFDGMRWADEEEISIDTKGENQNSPSVCAVNKQAHVVWENYDDQYSDIYYRPKFQYPAPVTTGVDIQRKWDNLHITDHTPLINWTYSCEDSMKQKGYNVSIWSGDFNSGKLMGSVNISGEETIWIYSGAKLQDGEYYDAYVQTFNGYRWSRWKHELFKMNTAPPTAENPNHHGDMVNVGKCGF
jgi:Fe-S cluster biogenesis protein NfuA